MSAIYGLVGFGNDAMLTAMGDRLLHRGTTRAEWQAGREVRFGCVLHRDALPPMQSAGKSVVGDVDIFATDSLRERLALAGLRFESELQEELVLRAYENAGPACLGEFNGYFAIAVWDEKERVLTLARDPTGFRPLFVWQEGS